MEEYKWCINFLMIMIMVTHTPHLFLIIYSKTGIKTGVLH